MVKLGFPRVCGPTGQTVGARRPKPAALNARISACGRFTSMTRWAVSPLSERYRTMSPRLALPGSTGSTVMSSLSRMLGYILLLLEILFGCLYSSFLHLYGDAGGVECTKSSTQHKTVLMNDRCRWGKDLSDIFQLRNAK